MLDGLIALLLAEINIPSSIFLKLGTPEKRTMTISLFFRVGFSKEVLTLLGYLPKAYNCSL